MGYGDLFAGLGGASGEFSKALGGLMQQRSQWNTAEQNRLQQGEQFEREMGFNEQEAAREERQFRAQMAQENRQFIDTMGYRQDRLEQEWDIAMQRIEQQGPFEGLGREGYEDLLGLRRDLSPQVKSAEIYQESRAGGGPSSADLRRSMGARAEEAARTFVQQNPGATAATWAGQRGEYLNRLREQFPSLDPAIILNELNSSFDRFKGGGQTNDEIIDALLQGGGGAAGAGTTTMPTGAGGAPQGASLGGPPRTTTPADAGPQGQDLSAMRDQAIRYIMQETGMSREEAEDELQRREQAAMGGGGP